VTDGEEGAVTDHADYPETAPPVEEEYGLAAVEPAETEQEETGLATVEPGEPSESADEDTRVEGLNQELQDAQDLLRRKHAEFENYRKRIEREQKEFVSYATSELVLEILPVLDNLERALGSAQSDESSSEKQIREGVAIIYRQFGDILQKAGLRELTALGEDFDPHVHQAVARVETTDHREGEILDVLQKGYFLKDRLLRPAMVRVGHNPSFNDSDTKSPEEVPATDDSSKSDPQRDA
jgi:molecular chaperone GrpE